MLIFEAWEDRLARAAALVAAYNFDQGIGSVLTDVSGNGNNGTIVNGTWSTSGKYGDALSFNGTNALVNVPNASSLCAVQTALRACGCKSGPVTGSLRSVAIGAAVTVTRLPKPSMQEAASGGRANRQAVTCVNAEQASKLLMREPSRLRTARADIAAATERPSLLRSRRGIGDGGISFIDLVA
jgi:hypothetical protein